MNRLPIVLLSILLFATCGKRETEKRAHPDEAAIYYVNLLAQEDYEAYVKEMVSCDSASDVYKEKMKIFLKQFVRRKKMHFKALKSVECLKSEATRTADGADTYLKITYQNDSTEITLFPLVWHKERWRLP